jgi:hypothetical protein
MVHTRLSRVRDKDQSDDVSLQQTPLSEQDNGDMVAKRMKERALAAKARKAALKRGDGDEVEEGRGGGGEEGQQSKEAWDGVS